MAGGERARPPPATAKAACREVTPPSLGKGFSVLIILITKFSQQNEQKNGRRAFYRLSPALCRRPQATDEIEEVGFPEDWQPPGGDFSFFMGRVCALRTETSWAGWVRDHFTQEAGFR